MMALQRGGQGNAPQPRNTLHPLGVPPSTPNAGSLAPISLSSLQSPMDLQINATNSPTFVGNAEGIVFNYNNYHIYSNVTFLPGTDVPVQFGETENPAQLPRGGTDHTNKEPIHIITKDNPGNNTNQESKVDLGKKIKIQSFGSQGKSFRLADEVAVLSANELVVLDRGHNELVTFLATDRRWSNTISQELQLKELREPSHIAIINGDNIVILDSPSVKIFKKGYQPCLGQFYLSEGEPTCLAVDDARNLIAIGYESREMVSLHKPNGELVKIISTPKIGQHLAIHNNRFIYISRDGTKLHAVDSKSKAIFSSDIRGDMTQSKAYGLCCDTESLFVAVHAGRLSVGEIIEYDRDGEYVGCVRRVRGYPSGIAFTPDKDMVVAVENAVNIYPSHSELYRQFAIRRRHVSK